MTFSHIYAGAYNVDVNGYHFMCIFRNRTTMIIVNYATELELTPDTEENAERIRAGLTRSAGGKRFNALEVQNISEELAEAARIIYPQEAS